MDEYFTLEQPKGCEEVITHPVWYLNSYKCHNNCKGLTYMSMLKYREVKCLVCGSTMYLAESRVAKTK